MNIHKVFLVFQKHFRKNRMKQFVELFNVTKNTRILDIGGGVLNWTFIKENPQVIMLNLSVSKPDNLPKNLAYVAGNALSLPFPDNSFDIAYSNSVIEHLYTFNNQKTFAREMLRVSKRIYMQTPNKSFLIEPHLITPFIHFLPEGLQRCLLKNFTIWGILTRPSKEKVDRFLKEVRLLTKSELKQLFPECKILKEKWLFLTKSYMVIKK